VWSINPHIFEGFAIQNHRSRKKDYFRIYLRYVSVSDCALQLMKKKPKKGAKPDAKPATKTEPVDSFFNFFSPPAVPEEGTDLEEAELEALHEEIENDYEMGEMIKTELIPNAVRW
jgi:hypothetical protein